MPKHRSSLAALALIAVGLAFLLTCDSENAVEPPTGIRPAAPDQMSLVSEQVVGAGQVARCDGTGDEATAALLDQIPGTVFALGDNIRATGTTADFNDCYGPSWGRHRNRTRPAVGDLEYKTAGAAGYFEYFGASAGDPSLGYYSYDLGSWHIIVLNSNITATTGSPQMQWLAADLASNTKECILAYWHHPRFSSYSTAVRAAVKPFWDALYAARADVVLNAHYRLYERFAPQNPGGTADLLGIRQFTVGTGGHGFDTFDTPLPTSEVRSTGTHGVLKLTLQDDGYSWEFVPIAGKTFTDAGSGGCHGASRAASVEVTPASGTVPAGGTLQLTATVRDQAGNVIGRPVTWTSSNDQVATVSGSGLVVAASAGSATMTATADGVNGSSAITVTPPPATAPVIVGAGDIASCDTEVDEATAKLLDQIPGTVVTLGDNAYPNGTASEYNNCYGPTWGRHKARTRPVAGNHEYNTPGASGYFGYFGSAAGEPGKGYYSYNLGEWHVIVLNDNVDPSAGSPQEQWLRADLAANERQCTLAMWHWPRFTSVEGRTTAAHIRPFWEALYEAGVDLVLNAHHHSYERFAPQRPDGTADPAFGLRQITVGTGGQSMYPWGQTAANSEVRNNVARGVMKVTLNSGGYSWQFIPVAGQTFTDAGTGSCHGKPGSSNQVPVSDPGSAYSGNEGTAVAFDGSGSSDPDNNLPLTYAWTFGDGGTGSGVSRSHTYADNGSFTVGLTVTDTRGGSNSATTTATIANVSPSVNAGTDKSLALGEGLSISAAFSDPGTSDGPWNYSIDWGDGSSENGSRTGQSSPIAASHTFTATGEYTVRVTVTDKDGGARSDELLATVGPPNQPPTADPGGPYSGSEGGSVAFSGTGSSDPDGDTPLTYAWNYGDGTTGTGASPQHTYAQSGSYPVSLTTTDARGLAGSPVTTTAVIANAAPAVAAGPDASLTVGAPLALSATFTDPATNDGPWSYTVEWGDGATTSGSVVTAGNPVTSSHSYAAPGQYTLQVTVTDKDGGAGSDERLVTVAAASGNQIIAAAGNISKCNNSRHFATAALIDNIPGPVTVLPLGDNAFPNGSLAQYRDCYHPSWGRHFDRTRAVLGNHDYRTASAQGAFTYFGDRVGPAGKGYYSFDLGEWHIIVLNTNGGTEVPYTVGSEQELWLRADLAANQKLCTMALFHEPRFFSSTTSGWTSASKPKVLWDALYAAGADVVLNGQMHHYERFAPQTPTAVRDDSRGIREFNVGVGGESVLMPTVIANNSEARSDNYGILKMTLSPTGYSWEFLPIPGQSFTDAGSGTCH
jgi:PKD repeat protein